MRFGVVQGCAAPAAMVPVLRRVARRSDAHITSIYRGEDAKKLLHHLGKHTQAELFRLHERHPTKYAPANKPGTSTHELRNDGVAYPKVKVGGKLPYWCVGIDINDEDVDRFIKEAHKEGLVVTRTYRSSHSERHHVNFRKPPRRVRARMRAEGLKEVPPVLNNIRFHYTSATLAGIAAAILTVLVEFGLHLTQKNIDTINVLVGLIVGGIVVGGGFKSRALLNAGIGEDGKTATADGKLGLHFTSATIVAVIGAAIAVAVSFGFNLTEMNINSVMKLVGLIFAGITFGGGVKSAGLLESGIHPALAAARVTAARGGRR